MSEWSETVKIGIILVIIAAVVNIVIGIVVSMQLNSKDINDQALNSVSVSENSELIKYDNANVTGAQAAVFIEKHYPAKDVGIIVNNGKQRKNYIRGISVNGSTAEFDDGAAVSQSGKISLESESNYYIKPSDTYISKTYKNKAGKIICVSFEKS